MAEDNTLARPYAQALFELASADSTMAEWAAALDAASLVTQQEQLLKLVDNPAITSDTLLGLLQDVLGGIPSAAILADKSSKGANFLKLLIENDRLDVLPEIATRFEALKDAAENTIDVTISSATGINDSQASEITQALTTRLGRAVNVTTTIDEDLIGGAVIRAGDFVIDGSVRSQLTKLSGVLSK